MLSLPQVVQPPPGGAAPEEGGGGGASLGPAEDEDELLRQASGCYSEALRLDPENAAARDGLDALTM